MKRSNVNVIIDNAINSQDYYRMYSSRDFYRGTSFKMAGAWTPDTHYFNDEHIIDFISCEGALLYCLRGHLSSEWNKPNLIYKDDIIVGVESNPYWAFIMGNSGKGQKGDKGDIGPIGPSGTDGITPQLKIEDGRWLLSMDKGQTWQDIGQATGDPGQNGTDGKNGSDGIGVIPGGTTGQALVKKSDADYDTEWKTISEGGEIPNFDAEVASVSSTTEANANVVLEGDIFKFSFGLPKGADGKDGENGKDGTNGTNGLNGENGSKGQIIYPEGIYNVNTVYQGTADKTPYVYDSNDANYYVLNIVGTWQGTLHSNESPSTDTSNSWVKLDAFEALYTKIGIIANGLIGSAVFNGNYMFSQQGIDASGQISTQYQNFDPEIPTGGEFTPNILFDFRTGAGHMAAGKIKFGSDRSVDLTNIKINNAIIQNIKQYSLTQSSDPHILDSLYSEIIYSPTIHEDVTLKVNASEYQLNIDDSYSGVIHNKSDKQLFIYPFDNGNDDESIKICGYYNGRLLFSYDEPILFNASQILLPAGGVLEFKFVPSSIVNNYYVGTIWVENTSDFELKTWKQNGTLRSDLYYKSYDDYNSDSFLACGEVYFNSSGVPSLSGFSRCRTDLVLTVSQSGNFSANLDLTSIYNRTLSISTIAFSQPIWDGAMLKMFYGSARGRINGAFLDVRTADGKVPTTSISVPFLILGSK